MSDNEVEEVKSKVDIISVIGEHVKLTKSGSNFKGLCPFHQEKTPSFMVSTELQIYKCFGCGEGGDVFTFLEKYEGMEFGEALHFLADKVGVKLTNTIGVPSSDKDILYEINALAAKFYNYLLVSHPIGKMALNYLKEERKIGLDSITTFNIGFAPANKSALSDFLINKKKYKVADLEKAGVIFISQGRKIYDRFDGRIIFPISDHRGNVIALAGRQLPPGNPRTGKYINSPETLIYHKSSSLYGLNITKDFIKKEGFAVVVEGEIDLISSFQIGIKNVVAIKGSAFTKDQANLLSRYTKDVVLALDTDFAGVAAAIRGIKILEDAGFEIRVARLGKYKDPDDAAKANPEFYKEKVSQSVGVWDFVIDSIVATYDKNTASGKAKIGKELTPILAQIGNKIVQEHYIHKLAKLLDVSDEAVGQEVEKNPSATQDTPQKPAANQTAKSQRELREENLLSLILKVKPELLKDKRLTALIKTPILKRIILDFKIEDFGKSLPKELFDKYAELVMKQTLDIPGDAAAKSEINNLYRLLALDFAKQKYKTADTPEASVAYQKEYKDFDSGNFERII